MISQKSSLNRANYSNVLHVLKNKKKNVKTISFNYYYTNETYI